MFWKNPPDALLYIVLAIVLICASIVVATLLLPCLWREGGRLDRRRTRRT